MVRLSINSVVWEFHATGHERDLRWTKGCQKPFVKSSFGIMKMGLFIALNRLINWDPFAQTALSNLEVENEEDFQTEIWSFAYPFV